jgi:hypothetical protein
MADERLQRLRRAAGRGDVEAQARLLMERVRCGEVGGARVRLAALLGDPAAIEASGVAPDARTLDKALAALVAESPERFVRVALGCARIVRPFVARFERGAMEVADSLLEATDAWLAATTARARQQAEARVLAVAEEVGSVHTGWIVGGSRKHRDVMLWVTGILEELATGAVLVSGKHRSGRSRVLNSMLSKLTLIEEHARPVWSHAAALRDELAPWLLTLPDPLAAAMRSAPKAASKRKKKKKKKGRSVAGPQPRCVCTGCRACKASRRGPCPTLVGVKGRDRCSKCWKIEEEERLVREFFANAPPIAW